MNRETLIAIFLGFAGGILVAFLLIVLPKKLQPSPTPANTSPTPTQQVNQTLLTITEPEDLSYITGEEVEIKGTTKANNQVIISSPSEDKIIKANQDGSFADKISLVEGENLLSVTVNIASDQIVTQTRKIYALKENL